jgi:hypothetical protein
VLASTSQQRSAEVRLSAAQLAELALPGRVRLGTAVCEPIRRLPSGLQQLDALLGGGWPCGRISEVLGPLSSGKTSLLLALLAAVIRRGEVAACVDLADALHPESLATAGMNLARLLWVRPHSLTDGLRCTELLLHAGGFAMVVLDLGTGAPRKVSDLAACSDPTGSGPAELTPTAGPRPLRRAVWPRLLYAAEQSRTALIILAPHRVAGSFAACSLRLQSRQSLWHRGTWPLFEGFEATALLERNKLGMPGQRLTLLVKHPAVDSPQSTVESKHEPSQNCRLTTVHWRRETESR